MIVVWWVMIILIGWEFFVFLMMLVIEECWGWRVLLVRML